MNEIIYSVLFTTVGLAFLAAIPGSGIIGAIYECFKDPEDIAAIRVGWIMRIGALLVLFVALVFIVGGLFWPLQLNAWIQSIIS